MVSHCSTLLTISGGIFIADAQGNNCHGLCLIIIAGSTLIWIVGIGTPIPISLSLLGGGFKSFSLVDMDACLP